MAVDEPRESGITPAPAARPRPGREGEPETAPARRGRPRSGGREAILAATLELLAERGASRMTTREVATRAGVSEGSVFYHFTDRTGLLTAAIEDGLDALRVTYTAGPADAALTLDALSAGIERFLDRAITVLIAAQSDVELRTGMTKYLLDNDFGPHRGVGNLAASVRAQQEAGLVRADLDPEAVGMMLLGAMFLQVSMQQMVSPGYADAMPGRAQVLSNLTKMLLPEGRPDAT